MKKIIIITIGLLSIANAQYYNVALKNCIIEFTDTSTLQIPYSYYAGAVTYREYADDDIEIRDNRNAQGFDIDKIANFSSTSILVDSLNKWQSMCSTSGIVQALNNICISCQGGGGVDSGEVIGDYLYLFQSGDTVIVDVSVLGDTSLWEIQNGILTVPSSYNGINTNGLIINDTLDLGFFKIPMYAGIYKNYLNGYFLNSLGNFTNLGLNGEKYVLGFVRPGRKVRVEIDTISVSMQASDISKIRIDTSNVSIQGSQNICDGSKYSTFISSTNSEIINLPSQYGNGAIISSTNCKLDYAQLGTIIGGFEIEAKGAHVTSLGAYGADGRGNLGTLNSYAGVFMGRNFPQLIDSTQSWYDEGYSLVIANGTDTLNPSTSFIVQKNGQVGISVANHNPDYSLEIGTTDAIKLPSGNTAERPTHLEEGVIRFNTDFNKIEYYDGSDIYSLHDNKPLPIYLNDAAADADSNLASGDYYKLTGDRAIYQKP